MSHFLLISSGAVFSKKFHEIIELEEYQYLGLNIFRIHIFKEIKGNHGT